MKKFLASILTLALCLGLATGCAGKQTPAENDTESAGETGVKEIPSLKIAFSPYADADQITTATEPLEQLLQAKLLEKGYDVKDIDMTVGTSYTAVGEALSAGSADIGFISGGNYVLFSDDCDVLLTALRYAINKDSENPADWNDGTIEENTKDMSTYYRCIILAGPSEKGQELQAKVLLKEQELNNGLKQQYDKILQEKRKSQPMISNADSLKIVNLQLKLQNLVLSQEERQAAEAELAQLLKSAEPSVVISGETTAEIDKEMAPYREKAQKELEEYAKTVKGDLEKRRDDSRSAFQSQLSALQDRPEPEEWNRQWKEKLQAKEKEMKDVKEAILADIRTRAADVAHEQGIEMIFCEYAGVGTARDVTDDIIARLG